MLYIKLICFVILQPVGVFSYLSIPYQDIEDIFLCVRLDSKTKYVVRVVLGDWSLLIQVCKFCVCIFCTAFLSKG